MAHKSMHDFYIIFIDELLKEDMKVLVTKKS